MNQPTIEFDIITYHKLLNIANIDANIIIEDCSKHFTDLFFKVCENGSHQDIETMLNSPFYETYICHKDILTKALESSIVMFERYKS